jgi:hypothetical protein
MPIALFGTIPIIIFIVSLNLPKGKFYGLLSMILFVFSIPLFLIILYLAFILKN